MALSPEQRKKAHEAGLQAKAEREAREEMAAKFGDGSDYADSDQPGLRTKKQSRD